ncbi:MAG TPA: MarR family transcriptional regulator [Candidatus Dormibacteraeota bacterium]
MDSKDRPASASILRATERLSQRTTRYLAARLDRLGVTDLEAHVLWHLRKGGRPLADLQAAFAIQPSTLTGVIDRLEKRQYARREFNPSDRRSYRIVLTPAGLKAATAVREALDQFEAQVRGRVRRSDLAGFFAVARAIDDVINAP